MNPVQAVQSTKRFSEPQVLRTILQELRLLRSEMMLLFPQDHLEDYAHPARIKRSYQKALKKYPPVSSV